MSMKYISLVEARAYNPVLDWETDAYVTSIIDQAEAMIDSYLVDYNFASTDIDDERHDYNGAWPYYLKYTPTSIDELGWTVVSVTEWTDYLAKGRRIMFAETVLVETYYNDTFGFLEINYTKSGTIPQNVKTATLMILNGLHSTKWMQWVAEYEQGDFRIKYKDGGFGGKVDDLHNIRKLLSPYRNVNVVS